ncbi:MULTISPECIES: DUF2059 domain-containing protein [Marinobacter]|uniref:DUF2059 domain-containing protein n=1 Tax=Marinobacter TaxID=2742 RepID=UPI00195517DF|nr:MULTISPECIES: DUF2059 domain-containing protein [Marinobacter]
MNTLKYLAFTLALATSSAALADAASTAEAEKLLDAINMEETLDRSISQMLDVQLNQQPSLKPYKDVMLRFFSKYMSYDNIKPDLVSIYADAFTAEELRELNAFYTTDIGQKAIRTMPDLMAKGAQMGAQRVQAHIGELRTMIAEEAERLEQQP